MEREVNLATEQELIESFCYGVTSILNAPCKNIQSLAISFKENNDWPPYYVQVSALVWILVRMLNIPQRPMC